MFHILNINHIKNTKYKVQVFRQKLIRDTKQKLFLNLTDLCSIKDDFYQKLL